jgi:hypothetical protein
MKQSAPNRQGQKLYVLGARQRRLIVKQEEEWNLYEAALIFELDIESGEVKAVVEHKTRPEASANENSSSVFKAGTLVGNTLYACTSTEVLIFQVPDFRLLNYISLPCFNDVHHVTPAADGTLLTANTGLDMVVRFTSQGEALQYWNVLGEDPWARFSPQTDYRKVESTKPHRSHPNFVFELDGQVWVTRFRQRDAICLTHTHKPIRIDIESPHDGLVKGGKIYFTTVDGHVVIVDRSSLQLEKTIDLKEIDGHGSILGWCRGILPVDERRCWVGFTRVRKTKFHENVLWVSRLMREGRKERPTHIALYDIVDKACLKEFDLEAHGMNIVFSIFPAVAVREKLGGPAATPALTQFS